MNVRDAVLARRSVRAFLPRAVDEALIEDALRVAAHAPSNGNLQPWRIIVVRGAALTQLRERSAARAAAGLQDAADYAVYPDPLPEPYRSLRREIGAALYACLGISREDREGRQRQFARNALLFDAPLGLFCYVDRRLGPGQWMDLGMYLQSLMLLLQAQGLGSCAQGYWSFHHATVASLLDPPPEWMLACGLAVGYADPAAPINGLVAPRQPLGDFVRVLASARSRVKD